MKCKNRVLRRTTDDGRRGRANKRPARAFSPEILRRQKIVYGSLNSTLNKRQWQIFQSVGKHATGRRRCHRRRRRTRTPSRTTTVLVPRQISIRRRRGPRRRKRQRARNVEERRRWKRTRINSGSKYRAGWFRMRQHYRCWQLLSRSPLVCSCPYINFSFTLGR